MRSEVHAIGIISSEVAKEDKFVDHVNAENINDVGVIGPRVGSRQADAVIGKCIPSIDDVPFTAFLGPVSFCKIPVAKIVRKEYTRLDRRIDS